jgi:hypothetical protein
MNQMVTPLIPAQDQNYGLDCTLLENTASTFDQATKDPGTAIRTGPPPKKREVIIIDSDSDDKPIAPTDNGKKCATKIDKSRSSSPKPINIDNLFLKSPVYQDNSTNASTSQQPLNDF